MSGARIEIEAVAHYQSGMEFCQPVVATYLDWGLFANKISYPPYPVPPLLISRGQKGSGLLILSGPIDSTLLIPNIIGE